MGRICMMLRYYVSPVEESLVQLEMLQLHMQDLLVPNLHGRIAQSNCASRPNPVKQKWDDHSPVYRVGCSIVLERLRSRLHREKNLRGDVSLKKLDGDVPGAKP
jgi:hypothetical protein